MHRNRVLTLLLALLCVFASSLLRAESPYIKLLKSGRVPADRLPTIVGLVAKQGEPDDLAYLLAQATADNATSDTQSIYLDGLSEASATRNLKPAGDLSPLKELLASDKPELRRKAISLAGRWKLAALAGNIEAVALDKKSTPGLRQTAMAALGAIGGAEAKKTFSRLSSADNPLAIRSLAVAGISQSDVPGAAKIATDVLAGVTASDDVGALIDAFLAQKDGPAALAQALTSAGKKIPADAAKLALRHLYSVGRSDEALVAALGAAAGISAEVKPPSDAELKALVAEVQAKGNAARGEQIFRRADLSCLKCHAISGAGGNVGPELSAVGQVSPVDYVLNSILVPELAVKEEFQLAKVFTSAGKVHVGIVKEDNPDRLVLRDAQGQNVIVPKDGDEEIVRGGSLMPKGLVNFLTHAELLDLVKFVSELGKPGAYALRSQPTVQRWRVLSPVPENLALNVPDETLLAREVLAAEGWLPVYGMVTGELPLAEAAQLAKSETLYLQGEINVSREGKVEIELASAPQGATVWLDDKRVELREGKGSGDVVAGVHKLTVRVAAGGTAKPLKVLVRPTSENGAEFTIVGGP